MTDDIIGDLLTQPVFVPSEETTPDHKAGKPRLNPFSKEAKAPATPREPIAEKAVPKNKLDVIATGLPGIYQMIGGMTMMFDPVCGEAIINSADECAASLVKVARTNPKVANALLKMMEGGAWGGVLIAHAPIIMVAASHHLTRKSGESKEEGSKPVTTKLAFLRPSTPGATG